VATCWSPAPIDDRAAPDGTLIGKLGGAADSTPGGTADAVRTTGITIYGCEPDEAALFRQVAPRFGVVPTITDDVVSVANTELVGGNRCISISHKNRITGATLRALYRAGVRYVSTRSVGYDHIDLECAARAGVSIGTVEYSPDSVADYTLMLMLMTVRHAESVVSRAGLHDYRLSDPRGRELRDLTIGVVGTGRIGKAVKRRLQGFGCRVLAHDRCPETAAGYVTLDRLLRESDVVTLHTPLTSDTHHLLDRRRIGQMRRDAVVVNTARGALIDTEALVWALEARRLGGAALDVLEGEDRVFYRDHRSTRLEHELLLRLRRLPNVLVTPHTAYFTDHALRDIVENSILNCLRFEGVVACRD
jgi:D-specific alpha-keto acid dehydrogenase